MILLLLLHLLPCEMCKSLNYGLCSRNVSTFCPFSPRQIIVTDSEREIERDVLCICKWHVYDDSRQRWGYENGCTPRKDDWIDFVYIFFSLFHIFPTWVFYMIHPMDLFKFEFCPKGLDRTVFKKYYFYCLSEFELREQWDAKKN